MAVEDQLEIEFPRDYKEWSSNYNTIVICHELTVFNYFDEVSRLAADLLQITSRYEGSRDGFTFQRDQVYDAGGINTGSKEPLPLYPNPGGLLLWAENSSCSYFWDTSNSNPDKWNVVVTDNEEYWQEFDMGFMKFLVKFILHELPFPEGLSRQWPWIPAYQECIGTESNRLQFTTPVRWREYFEESYRQDQMNLGGLEWVERFR
ncbi:SMI1/KNR4 family protein [Glycomyces terrestris]|nr:SMI1/KNR4 family protein [Glycomyces terrestris]